MFFSLRIMLGAFVAINLVCMQTFVEILFDIAYQLYLKYKVFDFFKI